MAALGSVGHASISSMILPSSPLGVFVWDERCGVVMALTPTPTFCLTLSSCKRYTSAKILYLQTAMLGGRCLKWGQRKVETEGFIWWTQTLHTLLIKLGYLWHTCTVWPRAEQGCWMKSIYVLNSFCYIERQGNICSLKYLYCVK